ncbi:hypothetical protein BN1221_01189c [Brenneria goodwinii]|uniref:Uncharacterized protein n=1 Tax=Brenneria goodwinii TaxID=1109412 RepID=A0A0G4JS91_9GAMM|nr:hypothetical protein BN1221_01189c [Brenneria goodwinii]
MLARHVSHELTFPGMSMVGDGIPIPYESGFCSSSVTKTRRNT